MNGGRLFSHNYPPDCDWDIFHCSSVRGKLDLGRLGSDPRTQNKNKHLRKNNTVGGVTQKQKQRTVLSIRAKSQRMVKGKKSCQQKSDRQDEHVCHQTTCSWNGLSSSTHPGRNSLATCWDMQSGAPATYFIYLGARSARHQHFFRSVCREKKWCLKRAFFCC